VVAVVAASLPGGLSGVIQMGREEDKFGMGEWRWDWQSRTVPTVLVYGLTSLVGQNLSYQVSRGFALHCFPRTTL
jgi:hypothetical protein